MKALIGVLAMAALTGCAAIRSQQAADSGALLADAGFKKFDLEAGHREPLRLVRRIEGGRTVYEFADPEFCRCRYVGGEKEHMVFSRLAAAAVDPRRHRESVPVPRRGNVLFFDGF